MMVILSTLFSYPVRATPTHCWSGEAFDAARVRELESMLMVAALRCRTEGSNLLTQYNAFIGESRPALIKINDRLRQHFTRSVGPIKSLNAYDSFVTSLANRYGAGASGLNCGDMESILSAALAEKGSIEGLIRLARDADMTPVPQTALCTVSQSETAAK
jgi:hypothetical protein